MERLDGAPKPAWSVESQLQQIKDLSIEYAVLSQSSPHFYFGDVQEATETAHACNEYGAKLKRSYPGRFAIMGSLPLPNVEAAIAEAHYCKEQLWLDGFALQTNYNGIYLGNRLRHCGNDKTNPVSTACL